MFFGSQAASFGISYNQSIPLCVFLFQLWFLSYCTAFHGVIGSWWRSRAVGPSTKTSKKSVPIVPSSSPLSSCSTSQPQPQPHRCLSTLMILWIMG
ncbi:unnamed protein product [Linum trigynum]|uniref:Uncharacterized protein n=1 Tax=Linum trigynum TaxID=586398 RepID=A0AAV2F8X8_9ROSI